MHTKLEISSSSCSAKPKSLYPLPISIPLSITPPAENCSSNDSNSSSSRVSVNSNTFNGNVCNKNYNNNKVLESRQLDNICVKKEIEARNLAIYEYVNGCKRFQPINGISEKINKSFKISSASFIENENVSPTKLDINETYPLCSESSLEHIIAIDEFNFGNENDIGCDEKNLFDESSLVQKDSDLQSFTTCANVNDDISLPPVNMIMDVLEHMLAEASASSSSPSSSTSEFVLEPLAIVPDSPKIMTSPPLDSSEKMFLTNAKETPSCEKTKPLCVPSNINKDDRKKTNLSLVCTKKAKTTEPGSDISTPSPLEEMSNIHLSMDKVNVSDVSTERSTAATTTTLSTTTLSTISLLSSVMAKHASKSASAAQSTADTNEKPVNIDEEKLLNTPTPASTTVASAADFFSALLKSDKVLASTSDQGNLRRVLLT